MVLFTIEIKVSTTEILVPQHITIIHTIQYESQHNRCMTTPTTFITDKCVGILSLLAYEAELSNIL